MVLCLAFGAGGMFLASNFRLRVEPVADPVAAAQPAPPTQPPPLPAEPAKLSEAVGGAPAPRGPIHDPAVVPAQGPAPVKGAEAEKTAPVVRTAVSVTESYTPPKGAEVTLTWKVQGEGNPPVLLFGPNPTVNLGAEMMVNRVEVIRGSKRVAVDKLKTADTTTKATLPLDFTAAPLNDIRGGLVMVEAEGTVDGKAVLYRVPLATPIATPSPESVLLTYYQTSSHADPVAVAEANLPVKLYGRDPPTYLVVRGRMFPGAARVGFVAAHNRTGHVVSELRAETASAPAGEVGFRLSNLPVFSADTAGLVGVRVEHADGHYYLSTPLTFTAQAIVSELAAPALTVEAPTGAPAGSSLSAAKSDPIRPSIPVYYTNNPNVKFKVVAADANPQVLLVTVGSPALTFRLAPPSDRAAGATRDHNLGADGIHAVQAAAARGEVLSPAATVEVRVRTAGPSVDGVHAPGFGTGGKTEKVVLRLSSRSQLNSAHAESAANYFIKHNEGTSTDVKVTAAVYDPAADTITLTVTGVVPGSYTLGIGKAPAAGAGTSGTPATPATPAVAFLDVFGNALQRPSGAGLDKDVYYQTVLFTQTIDQLASPTPGVPLQPAPAVEFPEYTKFREVPDGFNPSDRVETRVARLYYYRDAHRVAMIVNRTVKSYAAADVDVRRRAADRARTDADNATDERKRLENQAVKAAQDARAAETQLQEAQRKQADARVQSANARVILPQRELELQQATQNLGRAGTLVPGLEQADEALLRHRQQIESLTVQSEQLNKVVTAPAPPPDLEIFRAQKRDVDRQLIEANARTPLVEAEARARAAASADPNRTTVARLTSEVNQLRQVVASADTTAAAAANEVAQLQQRVTALRETEFQRTVTWQEQELRERRARENEFRRDVAAATADPNTYAPGNPESNDPVMQVSVSVIGEGLIQLRGPIKGINVIRIMINQIDAPVAQVRVAMHTVQVNGERGDRMEKVVANIQRYIDHSRFLTTQSSQMLRRAVGVVASRKAEEAALTLAPGCTQADRDQRYLYAFFGKEFTDELALLDSEFLKTGNKLLSLHSMDTTSLASALFVLSLARNDVRLEIMAEFNRLLQTELPEMENSYYLAGLSGNGHKCDACCDRRVYMLSNNARFISFGGFFNAQGAAADTMTPLQREFVRLAQVFKAQLVTELQLKQRVTERAMVEERFAVSYKVQRQQAVAAEVEAKQKLGQFQDKLQDALANVTTSLVAVQAEIDDVDVKLSEVESVLAPLSAFQKRKKDAVQPPRIPPAANGDPADTLRLAPVDRTNVEKWEGKTVKGAVRQVNVNKENGNIYLDQDDFGRQLATDLEKLKDRVGWFYYPGPLYDAHVKKIRDTVDDALKDKVLTPEAAKVIVDHTPLVLGVIRSEAAAARAKVQVVLSHLRGDEPAPSQAASEFAAFRADISEKLYRGRSLDVRAQAIFTQVAPRFNELVAVSAQYEAALRKAKLARRPLDEKKLLDLLVDEIEDKYIEQLEGTRAHTANIDNYIKALSTALDDDFQTQFYNPSFRRVREANARFWDVTLGQVETTTILVNNRGLALVRPSATFEFDLPKRDIMITEGFKSAKALVDDYGALVNDPSFLALAKLYSGNPVTTQQNTGGSLASVRNVLPGLPVTSDEMVMAQAGPGRREFGSALEGLIPDPAIYKFETGTGFELRPTLSPDGQNVVFHLQYMYTTDVREPVRADEKHLGRVKRHFIDTDVQLSNYELREVSTYRVALRASRTGKGVPGLQDIPGVGVLFRPLPSSESSLQQNLIYSQATIFPTLFDLMGLRYAPAVADLDPLADRLSEFAARNRQLDIMQRTADIGATRVDEALRTPPGERRTDLYRPVVTIPSVHPNGYVGPGLRLRDGTLVEGPPAPPGFDPRFARPATPFAPGTTPESAPRPIILQPSGPTGYTPPGAVPPFTPGSVPPVAPYPIPGSGPQTPPVAPYPIPGSGPALPPNPVSGRQDVLPLQPPRSPFAGASAGTAPPAGAGLGTVITPGVRAALPGTPGAVPPPFPAPAGLPAPAPLPPTGFPTSLPPTGFPTSLPNLPPAPGGAPGFPLPR